MALYHFSAKVLSRRSRNTVRAIAYRAGCELYDQQTGQTFNYEDKPVQHVELLLPKDAPQWAVEIQTLIAENRQKGVQAFVDIVEAAEKRMDARVYREFEFSLHREFTEEQNKALALEFVQDQLCGRGMAAKLNFHFDVDEKTGEENPHCHVVALTRRLEEDGLSLKKEREWNAKSHLLELREQWANYSNFYFKLNGHDIQIDHRSNKERGIEMEPQPKRGRGILEQERRHQNASEFVTDKAKAFHDVQLHNLYRIMRNPDEVLEIVTKHHATFMWADVQKKLHQYVDEAPLFQRLETKLKNSKELITLKMDPEDQDKAIYTTRSMLTAERSLIETAEELAQCKTHGVEASHIETAIAAANVRLEQHGGLSDDQVNAIHHLVDVGQIKCVVGIAGAGKTTALGVCHEIWKAEGYAVYGLAPTGKAAQNLESKNLEPKAQQNGIESTTLHKFLKGFAEGRCQYNEKTVLVLDEAGMVDMGRFEKLLGAVQKLGVKLIVVGDGAQLQPVEAGPAFRLVTTRLGKVELTTVVRQKEDWQREATVLFGQQKTAEAIKMYVDKKFVHIVEEKLTTLNKPEDCVKSYEIAHRVSSLMYREMAKEVQEQNPYATNPSYFIKQHKDFEGYLHWKEIEKKAAQSIFQNAEACRPILEERCLDPFKMALLLVGKNQPKPGSKTQQKEEARELLKECKLDHLMGVIKPTGTGVDVREKAKGALIKDWHDSFKEAPEKCSVMLAYSNRDVNDLNTQARALLKKSGHLSGEEFTYTIRCEVEDDFGRTRILKEQKVFSKGDRLVFTKNKFWLGVKNGTMGTITELDNQKVRVKVDDGPELSFSPNLNPYFDQGWAVTIHKSQGTTVDRSYVLASFEMTRNLAYVGMTRHREWVKVFGSSFDFWRPEKLPEVLSKSGEKLSAADYLDADSLNKLMQKDDVLLTKIFERVSNELEAMGAVTKKAFWQIADHFLGNYFQGNYSPGRTREPEIRINPESVREEVRAEEMLKKHEAHSISKQPSVPEAKETSSVEKEREVFNEITEKCQQHLYWHIAKENISLTNELKLRIPLQAEKAANFIFHAHTIKGTTPTEKETQLYLLRAKYELDRIPMISKKITTVWKAEGRFDEIKDPLLIRMIAERQASIEGRLYLEAKREGHTPPSHIAKLAERELQSNREQTKDIAQKLIAEHSLSDSAATHCARDILRYKETHGGKPTSSQIETMVQISRELEKKYNTSGGKEVEPHNIDFLRRHEGDLLFMQQCLQNKATIALEHHIVQTQATASLEHTVSQVTKEIEREHQKEMSM